VIADYAASGNRIGAILDRLRSSSTYADDLANRPANSEHASRAETMVAFLDQVDQRYGGVLTWLSEHGFDESEATNLRERLVA
jgi:protein-tyrosine phosphatase